MQVETAHFLTMGPVLISVVLLGKFLEGRAKLMALSATSDLSSEMPSEAVLCEESSETMIPVELIEIGDLLRIFAGAKIPVDGTICSEGVMYVDESLLTGESAPVTKVSGETVLGGTMCVSGGCIVRATKVGSDTAFGQVHLMVQEAQAIPCAATGAPSCET